MTISKSNINVHLFQNEKKKFSNSLKNMGHFTFKSCISLGRIELSDSIHCLHNIFVEFYSGVILA